MLQQPLQQLFKKLLEKGFALNVGIKDTGKISAKNLIIWPLAFARDVKMENIGLRNIDPHLTRNSKSLKSLGPTPSHNIKREIDPDNQKK